MVGQNLQAKRFEIRTENDFNSTSNLKRKLY